MTTCCRLSKNWASKQLSFFLRKIRKAKWYRSPDVAWLPAGELQADAMGDLQTSYNSLSVWKVEEDKSDLEDILTAVASTQDHLSHVDYVLISDKALDKLWIKRKYVLGGSHYPDMNNRHVDLTELTASQLYDLAKSILTVGEKIRVPEKTVGKLLAAAAKTGVIKMTDLRKSLADKIPLEFS